VNALAELLEPAAALPQVFRLLYRLPFTLTGPGLVLTCELCVTEPLPQLLDANGLQAELGITRAAAEAVMRQLPIVQFQDLRKTYCRREDVVRLIEARTFSKEQVPA
jgi:hypothetical protein